VLSIGNDCQVEGLGSGAGMKTGLAICLVAVDSWVSIQQLKALTMQRLHTFRADLFDAITHLIGYDCHVMPMNDAEGHFAEPIRSFFGLSRVTIGPTDWVYRGFGLAVVVSLVRVRLCLS
jgi:hypothetical protein